MPLAVRHRLAAEPPHVLGVALARGADNGGSGRGRDLDGHRADAAGGGVHQHGVVGADLENLDQRLVRR
jgi:hypothetical protein